MPNDNPNIFSIQALNRADHKQATAILDRIVERSAWLAERAAAARPFRDALHLADWLEAEVRGLSRDEAVQLLCAHPELSPPEPASLTQASRNEQGRLDLLGPDADLALRLADLNSRYLRRHGYPFVIALHAQQNLSEVLAEFEQRLGAEANDELSRSLGEVISVMKARLARTSGPAPKRKADPVSATQTGQSDP